MAKISREVFRRGSGMKYDDAADCFDPSWPRGLQFKSKELHRKFHGPDECWARHDDTIVKPNGRRAEFSRKPDPPDFLGIFANGAAPVKGKKS